MSKKSRGSYDGGMRDGSNFRGRRHNVFNDLWGFCGFRPSITKYLCWLFLTPGQLFICIAILLVLLLSGVNFYGIIIIALLILLLRFF